MRDFNVMVKRGMWQAQVSLWAEGPLFKHRLIDFANVGQARYGHEEVRLFGSRTGLLVSRADGQLAFAAIKRGRQIHYGGVKKRECLS